MLQFMPKQTIQPRQTVLLDLSDSNQGIDYIAHNYIVLFFLNFGFSVAQIYNLKHVIGQKTVLLIIPQI